MPNRRMITSDIFEDEFFIGLDLFGRILWLGIVVKCADDQGRMQDNSILIKSQVFPADDYQPEQIERFLLQFADAGRIIRYVSDGKKLIQILNWWKHQTPQWASKSRYPAPPGWVDREKYHAPGGKIAMNNWSLPGGYVTNQVTNIVSNPVANPDDNPSSKPIDEIKGEIKGDGEEEGTAPLPPERPSVFSVYEQEIGVLTPIITEELLLAEKEYPPGWIEDALREASKNNKRNWKYALAILKRWAVEGRGDKKDEKQPAVPTATLFGFRSMAEG